MDSERASGMTGGAEAEEGPRATRASVLGPPAVPGGQLPQAAKSGGKERWIVLNRTIKGAWLLNNRSRAPVEQEPGLPHWFVRGQKPAVSQMQKELFNSEKMVKEKADEEFKMIKKAVDEAIGQEKVRILRRTNQKMQLDDEPWKCILNLKENAPKAHKDVSKALVDAADAGVPIQVLLNSCTTLKDENETRSLKKALSARALSRTSLFWSIPRDASSKGPPVRANGLQAVHEHEAEEPGKNLAASVRSLQPGQRSQGAHVGSGRPAKRQQDVIMMEAQLEKTTEGHPKYERAKKELFKLMLKDEGDIGYRPAAVGDLPLHALFLHGLDDVGKEAVEEFYKVDMDEKNLVDLNTPYKSDLEPWKEQNILGWNDPYDDGGLYTGETCLHIAITQGKPDDASLVSWMLEKKAMVTTRATGAFFKGKVMKRRMPKEDDYFHDGYLAFNAVQLQLRQEIKERNQTNDKHRGSKDKKERKTKYLEDVHYGALMTKHRSIGWFRRFMRFLNGRQIGLNRWNEIILLFASFPFLSPYLTSVWRR